MQAAEMGRESRVDPVELGSFDQARRPISGERGKALDFVQDHAVFARPEARWVALSLPQRVQIVERDVLPALGRLRVPEKRALAHLPRSGENHDRVLGDGPPEMRREPAGDEV